MTPELAALAREAVAAEGTPDAAARLAMFAIVLARHLAARMDPATRADVFVMAAAMVTLRRLGDSTASAGLEELLVLLPEWREIDFERASPAILGRALDAAAGILTTH